VGHIRLSITDIEFVPDEIVLDDGDLILIDDHADKRPSARHEWRPTSHVRALRPFDDAVTRVWARAANLRACR
jgi:hypothetical protein